MNTRAPLACGSAALLLVLAGCGGATFSGAPGPEKDAGATDSGRDSGSPFLDGSTCEIYRIIPPVLTVTDQSTGAPICDVTVAGTAPGASLSACTGGECPKTCAYTVESYGGSSSFSITITAPGYGTTTVTGLTQGGCGCSDTCPAPQQVSATLTPSVTPPPTLDGGPQPTSVCPEGEPSAGAACSPDGIWCEYGTSTNPYCNDLFDCQNGIWQTMETNGVCPAPTDPCPDYASVQGGDVACSTQSQLCAYAQGTCICTSDPGGLPMEGNTPVWSCEAITPGCPGPLPQLGAACSVDPTTTCDYGICSGGVALDCTNGFWAIDQMIACAEAGGSP
jgi:hypothetical protein